MKTTKQNKIKRLTKKYFWEQKIKEIVVGFVCLITPYFLGLATQQIFSLDKPLKDEPIVYWLLGFASIIGIFLCCFFIFMVYMLIRYWIDSNWEKARERAEEEVR